jgi:molybdate transport system substrate-binding protein
MRNWLLALMTAASVSPISLESGFASEVRVLATGVYEHAVKDLAEPFKAQTGNSAAISITNAGGVIKQLDAGAKFDVVLTSLAGIDTLITKRMIKPESKAPIGDMRLGAAVKAGDAVPALHTMQDLHDAIENAKAVAYIDPKGGGTSGAFFEKLFAKLGVQDAIGSKGVPCATGNDVADALRSGRASLGLTQTSELIEAQGLRFVDRLPEEAQLVTTYGAGLTPNSDPAAEQFMRFLRGPGAERLTKAGFQVAKP